MGSTCTYIDTVFLLILITLLVPAYIKELRLSDSPKTSALVNGGAKIRTLQFTKFHKLSFNLRTWNDFDVLESEWYY